MSRNIVDILEGKSLQEPIDQTWGEGWSDGAFDIRVGKKKGSLGETLDNLRDKEEPLECDVCGKDVRRFKSEVFADIDFGGPQGAVRWFRLCKPCGERLAEEDDPRVTYAFRVWPKSSAEWRNSWTKGYELEGESGGFPTK